MTLTVISNYTPNKKYKFLSATNYKIILKWFFIYSIHCDFVTIHFNMIEWFGLIVYFYDISIIIGYSMPNPLYTYIYIYMYQIYMIWFGWVLWHINYCRCPWCSRYCRRKWTRRYEFKSWTRLIAFHVTLMPLGKVWIQLFSLQLWVNSRTD